LSVSEARVQFSPGEQHIGKDLFDICPAKQLSVLMSAVDVAADVILKVVVSIELVPRISSSSRERVGDLRV
jgi:hypothetical protein